MKFFSPDGATRFLAGVTMKFFQSSLLLIQATSLALASPAPRNGAAMSKLSCMYDAHPRCNQESHHVQLDCPQRDAQRQWHPTHNAARQRRVPRTVHPGAAQRLNQGPCHKRATRAKWRRGKKCFPALARSSPSRCHLLRRHTSHTVSTESRPEDDL